MPKTTKRNRRRAASGANAEVSRILADVIGRAVHAVQSQQVPAEQAIRAAMETLGAMQKNVLELTLSAAKAQAEIVQRLVIKQSDADMRALGSEIGSLLVKAAERGPEIIDSLSAGLAQFLNTTAGPAQPARTGATVPPRPAASATSSTPADVPSRSPQPLQDTAAQKLVPEPPLLTESQLLDAITGAIVEGYSAGRSGQAVAEGIRARYPAAIPTMHAYLSMDDFLVLMWMRQQPVLAEIATDPQFPQFYAELKTAILK